MTVAHNLDTNQNEFRAGHKTSGKNFRKPVFISDSAWWCLVLATVLVIFVCMQEIGNYSIQQYPHPLQNAQIAWFVSVLHQLYSFLEHLVRWK